MTREVIPVFPWSLSEWIDITSDTAPEEENYLSSTFVTKEGPASQEGTYNMFTLASKVQPIKVQVQLNSSWY